MQHVMQQSATTQQSGMLQLYTTYWLLCWHFNWEGIPTAITNNANCPNDRDGPNKKSMRMELKFNQESHQDLNCGHRCLWKTLEADLWQLHRSSWQ